MTQEVADTLRRAKALIPTPETWCQGTVLDALGRHCAVGAIEAVSLYPMNVRAIRSLHDSIGYVPDRWNDAPGRTHAEIIAAFDAAIAAEEREP